MGESFLLRPRQGVLEEKDPTVRRKNGSVWRTNVRNGLTESVESLFGNMKNDASENVRRGMHRHVGIAFNHLHLSLAAANFNLRTLRKWHQDTGKGDTANPLLADVAVQTTNVERPTRGTRRSRWAA